MATTFTPAFKNAIIDSITGRAASADSTLFSMMGFYAGAQTASPVDIPAGGYLTQAYPTGGGVNLAGIMSAVSGGISQITGSAASISAADYVGTVSTARIFNSIGLEIIDTTATLVGGGGGVIVPTLSASSSVNFVIDAFSIKMPNSLGSLYLNDALRDAIVNAMITSATAIGAGASASVNIYSGAAPANANLPATGTLLWTATTAAAGATWNLAAAGSAALSSSLSANASATGTAGYVRIVKGSYVIQGSIGTTGTTFTVASTALTSGASYAITGATIIL